MRIIYPKEIKDELAALAPLLMRVDGKWVPKADAPAGTQERYDIVIEKKHEFEGLHHIS